jgi:hypothetical protein
VFGPRSRGETVHGQRLARSLRPGMIVLLDRGFATLWPWRVSSAASLRVDLVVHRSGDTGSPRSSGSTRASSAERSPRSTSAARLRPPTRPARPVQRLSTRVQLSNAQRHRGLPDPGGPGNQPDPAMPQRPRLSAHQQPPLPLIQMREDRAELRRQNLLRFLVAAHTTSACRNPGSYGFLQALKGVDIASSLGFHEAR